VNLINHINALRAEATPGLWEDFWPARDGVIQLFATRADGMAHVEYEMTEADREYLVALHNAWPRIQAVIEAANKVAWTPRADWVILQEQQSKLKEALAALDQEGSDGTEI